MRLALKLATGAGKTMVMAIMAISIDSEQLESGEALDANFRDVEYADLLGIPFDFNATPTLAPPQPPRETGASRVNGSTAICNARAAPIRPSSNTRRFDPTEGSHPRRLEGIDCP